VPGVPTLIVVTGAPGSGKSTVAVPLAQRLGLQLIAKDDIKEALWEHVGPGDRDSFLAYGRASYPLMLLLARLLLASGTSAMVEANFTPDWAAEELSQLQLEVPVSFVQILCIADAATCLARYRKRATSDRRHPMHRLGGEETERSLERRLADGLWDSPIPLDGALFVLDTNVPVDVNALAADIAAANPKTGSG
jgi:predicted kinase